MSKYDLFFGLLEDTVKENFSPLYDTLINGLGEENVDFGITRIEEFYFSTTINTDVVKEILTGDTGKAGDLFSAGVSNIEQYTEEQLVDIIQLLKVFLGISPHPWEEDTYEFGFTNLANRYIALFKDFLNINPCIRFKEVTITNENQLSTTVNDLFMRFSLLIDGSVKTYPSLAKSTYKLSEALVGYTHSHIPKISLNNSGIAISRSNIRFEPCCLGRGPLASFYQINNKRKTLYTAENVKVDANLMMFASDLMEYVKVESLKGGPYIRLSGIGNAFGEGCITRTFDFYRKVNRNTSVLDLFTGRFDSIEFPNIINSSGSFVLSFRYIIHSFLHSLLENPEFDYKFINNFIEISGSDSSFCIDLTQRFVIHVNDLLSKGKLQKGTVKDIIKQKVMVPLVSENGRLVYKRKLSNSFSPTEKTRRILESDGTDSGIIFKGEPIPIKIIDDSPTIIDEDNTELYLHPQIVVIIRENIENFLNSKLNEKFEYIP